MHTDVIDHLTDSYGNRVATRPVFNRPLTQLSHHINHYSEAALILTTGPRQNPTRHATAELFHSSTTDFTDYTHYSRKITNNTELRRLPRGFASTNTHPHALNTHPHAECIGLYLHGHLIITWSLISRTASNQTTAVHYYFNHGYTLTSVTNARLNRFGPSTTRTHRNRGTLWVTNDLGSFRVKSPVLCVDVIDYYCEVN